MTPEHEEIGAALSDTLLPNEDSHPAVLEDDSTSSASSSCGPNFAFATWKAELELMLHSEGESVHKCVQSLQSEFDERSQFVRGDFAWRKQVTAFHDHMQDALTAQLEIFATSISKHATRVAESLAQTMAKVERDGQVAVQQQEKKGGAALRRARTALAKEVERITRLEKCLRQEEARQAAAILAGRENQLIAEHDEREKHLQALLGDMRSSNESLETLNTQLLDALRTYRAEIDQLRNTLVKSMSRPKRRSSSAVQAENRSASLEIPADRNGKNSAVRGLSALPSTANELLLVPTLRQSLSTATQSIGNLKNRVSELESAHKSDKQRLRELQLALTQAESEKAKATKLLGAARSTLIDNEKQLTEAADENARWKEKFDALEALAQGREHALADVQRLEDAMHEQVTSLTSRIQRQVVLEAQRHKFERDVASWRESQSQETLSLDAEQKIRGLESIVESYLRLGPDIEVKAMKLLGTMETQEEVEKRLRYEFERRFGEQLNLRVSYERRRILERLERLCAVEAEEKQKRDQRPRSSVTRISCSESDFTRLKRLVKSAYDQLGICVGAWSETDLDGLHAQLETLNVQVQVLEQKLEDELNRSELQRVHLVRAELAQQENNLLLAELTSRYRQLRATQAAWCTQELQQQEDEQRQPLERKPLTVYGIPQPLVQKPRLHTLMHLPLRSRPASASPCLVSAADLQTPILQRSIHQSSLPSPSRLGSHVRFKACDHYQALKRNEEREEEAEDHVRSVLKSKLLRPQIENQLEDTVGTDGVRSVR